MTRSDRERLATERHRTREAKRLVAIEALKRGKATQAEIGYVLGMTQQAVSRLAGEAGVRDPERRSRMARQAWQKGHNGNLKPGPGRKPVWPDCPPELRDDYRNLRRYMPAAEARAALERR